MAGNTTPRTAGTKWKKFRRTEMLRAIKAGTFVCALCGIKLDPEAPRNTLHAAELDHVVRVTDDPSREFDRRSVRWLCAPHHRTVTANQNRTTASNRKPPALPDKPRLPTTREW